MQITDLEYRTEQHYQMWLEDNHPDIVEQRDWEDLCAWRWNRDNPIRYNKPIYDPYEIFNPSKTLLRECIKELRAECYKYLKFESESDDHDFTRPFTQPRLDVLNRRIRELQYRMGPVSRNPKEITPDTIARAKESPIQDYLVGWKCRRSGQTLYGKCPIHNERSGSFVVYTASNRWHCFGACSIGGDVIDLVCKIQNLKFHEAIRWILKI